MTMHQVMNSHLPQIAIDRSRHEFRLGSWFMGLSFFAIVINSLMLAWVLVGYMSHQMLERDAVVSMEIVNSIVHVQRAHKYFHGDKFDGQAPEMEEFFSHVSVLPDVVRANVYGGDRSVLWSSNPAMIGKSFSDNADLERAFRGEFAPEIKNVDRDHKPEHVSFPAGVTEFIEFYVPIWNEAGDEVVGAVEVYKSPVHLLAAIRTVERYVWTGALLGAIALYGSLAFVAWHARRMLRSMEARTVEAERLAVVGEMASAVAHGLRNPLASIRSCAELVLDEDIPDETKVPIRDIVDQSDRLERWIRSFLVQTRGSGDSIAQPIQIDAVITECFEGFRLQMASRKIEPVLALDGDSPIVVAQAAELSQVFNSVISNGIEAIQNEGRIRVERSITPDGKVSVVFLDTGPGLRPEMIERLFQPFATTKSSGIGVGLALARRIIERLGGTVDLANAPESGARVTVQIPCMRIAS